MHALILLLALHAPAPFPRPGDPPAWLQCGTIWEASYGGEPTAVVFGRDGTVLVRRAGATWRGRWSLDGPDAVRMAVGDEAFLAWPDDYKPGEHREGPGPRLRTTGFVTVRWPSDPCPMPRRLTPWVPPAWEGWP